MRVKALAVLPALVFLWAPRTLAGAKEKAPELVEMDLGGGRFVTFFRYGGKAYEKVPADAVRKTSMAGKLICVEGKLADVRRASFTVMASRAEFLFRDGKVVKSILRGDNIWIGGEARKHRAKAGCFLMVHYVVKLKDDFALFDERYLIFKKDKNWRKLAELGKWIEEMGKISAPDQYKGFERYKQYARRAYRNSLVLRAEGLSSKDADGFYGIAVKLLEIEGSRREAIRFLRTAAQIDPDHAKVGELLKSFGFVRYRDEWLTKTEKAKRIEEEKRLAESRRQQEEEARKRKAELEQMMRRNREVLLHDLVQKVRLGTEKGLTEVAKYLGGHEDEVLCRSVLFEVANSNEPAAVDAFLKAARNPSAEVRCDVVDALAWRGGNDSRALIASMVGSESSPLKARIHAVDALVWMGGVGATDSLVGLAEEDTKEVKDKVFTALTQLTGKTHKSAEEWRLWWQANKADFEPKREH